MDRYRKIKKYGNSCVIALFKSDLIDFDLKVGDEIEISDIVKKEKTKSNKKK